MASDILIVDDEAPNLRLLRRVLGDEYEVLPAASGSEAIALLFEEVAGTDHVFWPDDISLLDEQLIDRSRILGPKQLAQLYQLAEKS